MRVSARTILLGWALSLLPLICLAADEPIIVDGYEEAFKALRQQVRPADSGTSVEAAIAQFYDEKDGDPGSYPASEYFENDNTLKRNKPERLRYSGRMFLRYSDEDLSEVEKWEKLFELNLRYADWDAWLRYADYTVFAYQNDPTRLEKARLRYRGDDTTVVLGSFGEIFGRGLALSMFEDTFVDHDNELEGINVETEWGNSEWTMLWGQYKKRSDARHAEVAAVRTLLPLADNVELGIHSINIEFPASNIGGEGGGDVAPPGPAVAQVPAPIDDAEKVITPLNDYQLLGADLTVREGPFRLYLETVGLQRGMVEDATEEIDQTGSDGRGYSISIEMKDYDEIAHPFAVLPPVRRWPEKASAIPADDKGYGVQLLLPSPNDTSYYEFSYGQDNRHGKGELYTEFGAKYAAPSGGPLTWTMQYWNVNDFGDMHDMLQWTGNQKLSEDWTSTYIIEREHRHFSYVDYAYNDYKLEAEMAYESSFFAAYTWETTKNPFAEKNEWGIWELKWRPDQNQEFNLVWGDRRDGVVCSGGVCRSEPAFSGFKLDYLLRF